METPLNTLHVGKIIKTYLQQTHLAQAVVARRMNVKDRVIVYYLGSAHISSKKLLEFSQALRYNLFAEIARHLPDAYATPTTDATEKDQRISALEEENRLLKSQLALLERLMKKE